MTARQPKRPFPNEPGEVWKKIKGFEGYFISNLGRVWSYRGLGRILSPHIQNIGYKALVLRRNGQSFPKRIHRLVAEEFIPKVKGKTHINHIDGDKLNNSIENLEWCTRSENGLHAFRMGLNTGVPKRPVIATRLSDGKEFRFDSATDAGRLGFGSQSGINKVVLGKGKTCFGCTWRFAEE